MERASGDRRFSLCPPHRPDARAAMLQFHLKGVCRHQPNAFTGPAAKPGRTGLCRPCHTAQNPPNLGEHLRLLFLPQGGAVGADAADSRPGPGLWGGDHLPSNGLGHTGAVRGPVPCQWLRHVHGRRHAIRQCFPGLPPNLCPPYRQQPAPASGRTAERPGQPAQAGNS